MWQDLDFWRGVTLGSAALGQTCFVVLYMTFPWWRSFLGRALFYKATILAVLADLAFSARVFGFKNMDVVFVVVYGLLASGIWFQFFAFLRVKRAGRAGAAV